MGAGRHKAARVGGARGLRRGRGAPSLAQLEQELNGGTNARRAAKREIIKRHAVTDGGGVQRCNDRPVFADAEAAQRCLDELTRELNLHRYVIRECVARGGQHVHLIPTEL